MTIEPEQVAGIEVEKTVAPLSLPEPGGDFTFTVVVSNPGEEAITITALVDDIYGDLAELGDCGALIGLRLQPDGSGTCTFVGEFTGIAGDIQTDVVTVTAEDDAGATVTASDEAVVAITPAPTTTTTAPTTTTTARPGAPTTSPPTTTPRSTPATAPAQPRLAATGTEPTTTLSVGVGLAGVGLLLLGQAVRLSARRRPGSGAGSH